MLTIRGVLPTIMDQGVIKYLIKLGRVVTTKVVSYGIKAKQFHVLKLTCHFQEEKMPTCILPPKDRKEGVIKFVYGLMVGVKILAFSPLDNGT